MNWIRGESLGYGSFATVNMALPGKGSSKFLIPFLTAVKSSDLDTSYMLKNEKDILDRLGSSSPYVINCYGHDQTLEDGKELYNIFLEYAAGGSLADQLKKQGAGNFPERDVRRYTRSILEGLNHIHTKGFVHCDVKLQNILVFYDGNVKIADFGLAKEKGIKQTKCECRGTPLFMSPESANDNEYESPADIWALGCAVVEMATGKPAWDVGSGKNIWSLLIRIGVGDELPKIPEELSKEGKDFLNKCFVKDPQKRWSSEMLLNHPFIANNDDNHDTHTLSFDKIKELLPSPSPRTHFDFPRSTLCSPLHSDDKCSLSSPRNRLLALVSDDRPVDWAESDGWIIVR